MITKTEVKEIYASNYIDLSDADVNEITDDANNCEKTDPRNLTAHQFVVRWLQDQLRENMDTSSFSERLEYDFSQN